MKQILFDYNDYWKLGEINIMLENQIITPTDPTVIPNIIFSNRIKWFYLDDIFTGQIKLGKTLEIRYKGVDFEFTLYHTYKKREREAEPDRGITEYTFVENLKVELEFLPYYDSKGVPIHASSKMIDCLAVYIEGEIN